MKQTCTDASEEVSKLLPSQPEALQEQMTALKMGNELEVSKLLEKVAVLEAQLAAAMHKDEVAEDGHEGGHEDGHEAGAAAMQKEGGDARMIGEEGEAASLRLPDPMSSECGTYPSCTKVNSVICDSGSVPRRAIFSP